MHEVYHFNVESSFDIDKGEGNYTIFTQHTGNDYARTSLPLVKKITFNAEPLYDKYIAPAIEKLRSMPTIHKVPTVQSAQTQKPNNTTFTAE